MINVPPASTHGTGLMSNTEKGAVTPTDGSGHPGNQADKRAGFPLIDCAAIITQIHFDEKTGFEQLYCLVQRGLRYHLRRRLSRDNVDSQVSKILTNVVQAIRKGDLGEPEQLLDFVRTIANRLIACESEHRMEHRRQNGRGEDIFAAVTPPGTQEKIRLAKKVEVMKKVLAGIGSKQRDALERYYLRGQPAEQICQGMWLTQDEFRLIKSLATAGLAEAD